MKLLTLITPTLLAATAYASEDSSSSSISSSSSSSSSASAKPSDPPTAGSLWSPRWSDPLLTTLGLTKHCHSTSTFKAKIYKLAELYPTLKDYAPQLKVFYHKQVYPGSWDGVDVHGEKRELLRMEYEDLPWGMREWLKGKPKQRMFSLQGEGGGEWAGSEGVAFFAPGAVSPTLPRWVDGSEEEGCDGVFDDLDNYSVDPKDGVVLGRIEHKSIGDNEVEFTVEAFQVRKTMPSINFNVVGDDEVKAEVEAPAEAESTKDEL